MLHQRIALLLAICKWPLALACLAFLPSSAYCLFQQIIAFGKGATHWWPIGAGMLLYLVIWYKLMRHAAISFLSTLEHEITHCIFAWLTFNQVVGLKATLRSGGHMSYVGTPNWLIQTAPYFFPTVTVLLLITMAIGHRPWDPPMLGVLGATFAYHLTSTWTETSHTQTDLQKAGLFFSTLFLPTINLLCCALILAYLRLGLQGFTQVFSFLLHSALNPVRLLR